MADEIARFYPSSKPTPVVRLAPFASARPLDQPNAAAIVAGFGIDYPYLLCPTHLPVHKNLGPLIAGVAILRDKFPHLRLVLTGVGTQAATGRATAIGTVRDDGSPDVIGLGYVTNTQIDSLIECASVVVNPSLYEAGNGSGLDAWSRGTPVAMSDIPAFAEHLTALGVSAALFDPRSPNDIAAKIGEILENEPRWRGLAHTSREALRTLTWDGVARGYLDVFDAAFDGASRG
jgi:glycosyltransferase involved in cell wall biosynthesis